MLPRRSAACRASPGMPRPVCHAFSLRVSPEQHAQQLSFALAAEPAFARTVARVVEGSEQDVPQRQVGKIVAVMADLVMPAMAFRTLEQEAQPPGRTQVAVIDELGE